MSEIRHESEPLLPAVKLAQKIQSWNEMLETCGREQLDTLSVDAVTELDGYVKTMGIYGAECIISGVGSWKELVRADDGSVIDIDTYEGQPFSGKTGLCSGFYVRHDSVEGKAKIHYGFALPPEQERVDHLHRRDNRFYLYAPAETVTVIPMSAIREVLDGAAVPRQTTSQGIVQSLIRTSELYKQVTGSVAFTQWDESRKQSFRDRYVQQTERQSGIVNLKTVVEAHALYVPDAQPDSAMDYVCIQAGGTALHGISIGLTHGTYNGSEDVALVIDVSQSKEHVRDGETIKAAIHIPLTDNIAAMRFPA